MKRNTIGGKPTNDQRAGVGMTTRRWVDGVNVMLGVWLIASPWFLTQAGVDSPVAWGAWSAGAAIVSLASFSTYKPAVRGDTVGILLGAWLMASPWILGFASDSVAAMNAVIIGLLIIGYALWAMRIDITSGDGAAYDTNQRRPA